MARSISCWFLYQAVCVLLFNSLNFSAAGYDGLPTRQPGACMGAARTAVLWSAATVCHASCAVGRHVHCCCAVLKACSACCC
jgi:hypothetical protein